MKKHRHEWGKINIEVSVANEILEKIQEKFPNVNDDLVCSNCWFVIKCKKNKNDELTFHLLDIKKVNVLQKLKQRHSISKNSSIICPLL